MQYGPFLFITNKAAGLCPSSSGSYPNTSTAWDILKVGTLVLAYLLWLSGDTTPSTMHRWSHGTWVADDDDDRLTEYGDNGLVDYGNDGLTDHGDDVLAEPGNRSASMNG